MKLIKNNSLWDMRSYGFLIEFGQCTLLDFWVFVPLCERYIARRFGYNRACHVVLEVIEVADFAFGILRHRGHLMYDYG